MLTGTLGIRLILWLGKAVPHPAPRDLTAAVTDVSVTNDAGGPDGFQLTLSLAKNRLLDYGPVSGEALDPMTRIVIGVLMGARPHVLIDGVVTHHQLAPSNEPGASALTVTGRDLTQVMDLEEKSEKYENQSDSLIVDRLVASYGRYGLIPASVPTKNVPLVVKRIPRQYETDLAFIQRMARRNGYVFYVEPVVFGVNRAYFGPEIRAGVPQPALSQNMGAATNVKSLSFSNDALAPVATRGSFVEPHSKLPVPILTPPSLRLPPLARSAAPALRTVQLRTTAGEDAAGAATTAVAAVSGAPEPVTGEGELDAARYGHVLRARQPVGVRGAGVTYDGFYYVRRVTHSLKRGQYTQRFSLSREGTGALLPVVPA